MKMATAAITEVTARRGAKQIGSTRRATRPLIPSDRHTGKRSWMANLGDAKRRHAAQRNRYEACRLERDHYW
jgi:hypothetical protein